MVLSSPPPAGCTASGYGRLPDTLLYGGSTLATLYATGSWDACASSCTLQPGCVAFSWATPSFSSTGSILFYTCLLFGPGTGQTAVPDVDSGTIQAACQPPPVSQSPSLPPRPSCTSTGYSLLPNTLLYGNTLATLYATASWSACASSCSLQMGCTAFSWANPSYVTSTGTMILYTCVLFGASTGQAAVVNVNSGLQQSGCQPPGQPPPPPPPTYTPMPTQQPPPSPIVVKTQSAGSNVLDVWILAGQSNMIGNNYLDGQSITSISAAQPLPNVIITFPAYTSSAATVNLNQWINVNTLAVSQGDVGNGYPSGYPGMPAAIG